jgi:hypothetical protein
MTGPQAGFERRVQSGLEAASSRIPIVLGGCGSGRTTLLHRLRAQMGPGAAQYIDLERCATTPERFLEAVTRSSPFPKNGHYGSMASPREAFDAALHFFDTARAPAGQPCTFLLDEFLELRTFESFPGLRHVLRTTIDSLSASPNRFVLTTRYAARANRLLRDATSRYEVMPVPPLAPEGVTDLLAPWFNGYDQTSPTDRDEMARRVHALTGGRPSYARALGEAMAQMGRTPDPVHALAALLSTDGALDHGCRFCYELRLHRARGYGALKAILDILAEAEPLNLTEVAHRLKRTPGSTKDYLSWLEDVDLVASQRRKYSFADPLLRLWVRLHCRPTPPSSDEVALEVQRYAEVRLASLLVPSPEAVAAGEADASADDRKNWGIIEID